MAATAGSRVGKKGLYDTVLAVYTQDEQGFTEVACNDDAPGGIDPDNPYASFVHFRATARTTYYFQVGSLGAPRPRKGERLVFKLMQ
jgi:hypothetical protein